MKKIFLLFIFFSLSILTFGQDTTITIYFNSGQSSLTPSQKKSIDKLQLKPISKLTINGYADTVGKTTFNKHLSYKRALTTAKMINAENKSIVGKGESKGEKVPLHKMRKVVVNVWYESSLVKTKPAEEKEKKSETVDSTFVLADKCITDTIIYSKSGSMIKINKCYYERIKDCFKYKEYLDAGSAQQAGLRTIDEDGIPIESGGMIDITFCADTCPKSPVTVFLPVPICLSGQTMTLWRLTKNNTWQDSKNKIEIVEINGAKFYKMEIPWSGIANCDKPIIKCNKRSKVRLKVKLKDDLKIIHASLTTECPLQILEGRIKKNKKVAKFSYKCPFDEIPKLALQAYNKNGDTLSIYDKYNKYKFKYRKRIIIYKKDFDANSEIKK